MHLPHKFTSIALYAKRCKKYACICKICKHEFICIICTSHFADETLKWPESIAHKHLDTVELSPTTCLF